MRPVSAEFLDAVRHSHAMVCEAKVVKGHQTGVNPSGVVVPINGGDVVSDATAEVRATLDLTTVRDVSARTPLTFPDAATDVLAPYGNEIFVRRGIRFGDRSVEWVSLGYFRIDSVSQDTAPTGQIRISGKDRMAGIKDGRLIQPVQFGALTTVEVVFETLILEVYPDAVIEFDFAAESQAIGRNLVEEEDRYGLLADLATSLAKDFYVDYRGIFVVQDAPDPTEAVFEVTSGENGVLVSLDREINREGAFNAVVATGQGADTVDPVRAVAKDLAADSPTRWGGPFGKVPRFYSSPFITTTGQAQSAARKILLDELGLPYSLDFAAVPNPALEPRDPVRVRIADHHYVHTLQRVTTPLTSQAAMTATTKNQTTISIGFD